jgi:hypothetical protein
VAESFTVLWTADRCRHLQKYGQEGSRLELLFGGPHQSLPSLRRAGVRAGDWIYPIRVHQGVLYVIARMKVRRLLSVEEYIAENAGLFAGLQGPAPAITLQRYFQAHPEKAYLAPTCTDEVALGEQGTPIRLDITAAPAMVERLRFRSQRGERGIKHLQNGRITKTISLQGIYRLSDGSAQELEALLLAGLGQEVARQSTMPS